MQATVQEALQMVETPRMWLLGRTGGGKTSLLNATLHRRLLPSWDTGRAVTRTVTEVRHKQRPRREAKLRLFLFTGTASDNCLRMFGDRAGEHLVPFHAVPVPLLTWHKAALRR